MSLAVLVVVAVVALVLFGFIYIVASFYRQVEQGKALIISRRGSEVPDVTFTGAVVLPIINKAELMDISLNAMKIDRRGHQGLICRDNIRADIEVTFFMRVNRKHEDVIKVAQSVGCARASNARTLEDLFTAKFSEALKTVGKQLDFVDLYTMRHEFRDQIIEVIGKDLHGYVLEDVAIDYLEQTPLTELDRDNILDAQGIRKITELTTPEHVRTNEFQNTEKKLIKKQDVEAAQAILEQERQQAEAEAKQKREVETRRAREQAETLKIQAEERLRAELARIKADEEIQVNDQNRQRQVEVAEKNRERVVGIETERAVRDRTLEAIGREREVELQRIAKDKAVEMEKKLIQEVIRERVSVEKTVAEEEERIKTVRVVEQARREKDALVLAAEAEAQEGLVKGIKAAEASEQASRHKAKERLTLAEAELEAAEKLAKAKIRQAEGTQAEAAAAGLGEVRVKEADAQAVEKVGLAQARVLRETGFAEAAAIKERGLCEGAALKERLTGEAEGLTEKAKAMQALDDASRGHEEFRLRIETERSLGLETIKARKETALNIAEAQVKILSDALRSAKIDIVGGDGVFVDKLMGAIAAGKAVDRFFDRSDVMQQLAGDYLSGQKDLARDLKDVLSQPGVSSGALQNLTLAALLARLIATSDKDGQGKLQKVLETAKSLGIDQVGLGGRREG